MEQVTIIGSGPAGYTAAIYAARASVQPVVFEGLTPGGQLTVSHEVENYPGYATPKSGAELMEAFKAQAERLGARIVAEQVTSVERKDAQFVLATDSGVVESRVVIAATGAEARRLPIPAEKKFYGRGVSGCATCDAAFFRGKTVLVVGGGNTAIDDALFLTRFARAVTMVHRRDYFRAAPSAVEKARRHPQISWRIPFTVEDILGDNEVTGAVLKNVATGATESIACDGIFVAIGHEPQSGLFAALADRDEHGYIKVASGSTATRTPGLFACGDVMDPLYKQAVTAAGTGCMAALDAQRYLEQTG
jgi:thioredoxin reductase (NADPH)